jgi:hypothetical protein
MKSTYHKYSKEFDEEATHINALYDEHLIFKPHPELKYLRFDTLKSLILNQKIEKLYGRVLDNTSVKLPASLIEAEITGTFDFSECINLKKLICITYKGIIDVRNVIMIDECSVDCKNFYYNSNIRSLRIYNLDNFVAMSKLKKLYIARCKNIDIKNSDIIDLTTDVVCDFPNLKILHIDKMLETFEIPFSLEILHIKCGTLIADKNCMLKDLTCYLTGKMPKALLNLQCLKALRKDYKVVKLDCYMPNLRYIEGNFIDVFPARVKVSIMTKKYKRSKNVYHSTHNSYDNKIKDFSYSSFSYGKNKFRKIINKFIS